MKFEIETDSPRGLQSALEHASNVLHTMGSYVESIQIQEAHASVTSQIEKNLTTTLSESLKFTMLIELETAFGQKKEFSIQELEAVDKLLCTWRDELETAGAASNQELLERVYSAIVNVNQQIEALIVLDETN